MHLKASSPQQASFPNHMHDLSSAELRSPSANCNGDFSLALVAHTNSVSVYWWSMRTPTGKKGQFNLCPCPLPRQSMGKCLQRMSRHGKRFSALGHWCSSYLLHSALTGLDRLLASVHSFSGLCPVSWTFKGHRWQRVIPMAVSCHLHMTTCNRQGSCWPFNTDSSL